MTQHPLDSDINNNFMKHILQAPVFIWTRAWKWQNVIWSSERYHNNKGSYFTDLLEIEKKNGFEIEVKFRKLNYREAKLLNMAIFDWQD